MRLSFSTFRARVLAFVAGLLVVVQGAVLVAVNAAQQREARRHVDEALELSAAAFARALAVRDEILVERARLLSSDFAFKQAVASRDHPTVLSALENHRARVGADAMALLTPDGETLADTRRPAARGGASDLAPLLHEAQADEFGEAASILLLDGAALQLVAVPFFTPEPSAWIAIGFAVGDAFAGELGRQTRTQVSLLRREAEVWSVLGSTLPDAARAELVRALPQAPLAHVEVATVELGAEAFVSRVAPLDGPVVAVLQRSLDEALAPYQRLRALLLAILAGGLALSVLGGAWLAGRATRPVAELARAARRVREGDYGEPVRVEGRDELATLGASFNEMMQGLAERDRVRDLLGRVVAPQIAEELLRTTIELGGEERIVSVLFADIRGFTALAEREDPQRLVRILNAFLGAVSAAIDAHGGVVEEYIGDGVKALFGAPLAHPDDAQRAVRAALALQAAQPKLQAEIAAQGGPPLDVAVGIHTGPVVAGRMGSLARLKYTVVGDGVNLASRLEGLCRRYGVGIVASDATRAACPGIVFRELDRVRVKGRAAPVAIHEPLGERAALAPERLTELEEHRDALARLRARDWDAARAGLEALCRRRPADPLYRLQLERARRLAASPPPPDWDGTVDHEDK